MNKFENCTFSDYPTRPKDSAWLDVAAVLLVVIITWSFGHAAVNFFKDSEQLEHDRAECILNDNSSDYCCELIEDKKP